MGAKRGFRGNALQGETCALQQALVGAEGLHAQMVIDHAVPVWENN